MNPAAAGAALALAVAAPLSALGRAAGRRAADLTSRGLAAGAGLLLLAAARPTALPAAVLAFAAAGIAPRALPCLLAAAAAVAAAARLAPEASPTGLGVWTLGAALALALAASAIQETVEAPGAAPQVRAAWTAAAGGALLALTLIVVDRGQILHWRFGLGAGAARLELPGAALVLALALLVSLAGAMATGVHALAAAPRPTRMGLIGQRLLVLGAGLGGLGAAVVAGQGLRRSEALAGGAMDLAAMVLAVGVLVLALIRLLAAPPAPGAAGVGDGWPSERILRLAAAVAMLSAAVAGVESWRAEGTYATTALAETASAALLGLVAVQPTRLHLARAALFVVALVALVARAI